MNTTYKKPESVPSGTFIHDGIINHSLWGKNGKKKILFFLKEAYLKEAYTDTNVSEFSLTRFLDKGKIPAMWQNAASWAYMMNHPDEPRLKDKKNLDEIIRYCAIVNIKKINGKTKSNVKDLQLYFDANQENLKAQIIEINPDIIITGGTFVLLNKIFKMKKEHTHVPGSGMGFYNDKDSPTIVARLRHPSYLKARKDDYFEAVREMYKGFVKGI